MTLEGRERALTEEEIRQVVSLTVKELMKEGMTKEFDDVIFEETKRLLSYHFNEKYSEDVARVLNDIKTDEYYPIIPLHYGKGLTHEAIAEKMGREVSTITRNKKRLCKEIYKLLN